MNFAFPKTLALTLAGCSFVMLSGCQATSESNKKAEPALPTSLGEYITVDPSIEIPAAPHLALYTAPIDILDANVLGACLFDDYDSVEIRSIPEEGVAFADSDEGRLQVVVNDFVFYAKSTQPTGEAQERFEKYSSVLSLLPNLIPHLRYAYIPENIQTTGDLSFAGTSDAEKTCQNKKEALGLSFADQPYRTEKVTAESVKNIIDQNAGLLTSSVTAGEDFSDMEFYRFFWNAQVDGVPILYPDCEFVGNAASGATSIQMPYLEMLVDSAGIQYVCGKSCITSMEKQDETFEPTSARDGLDVIKNYFADTIVTEKNPVQIQSIKIAYVAVASQHSITLEPAWVYGYDQAGEKKCIAVDMRTGEWL